MRGGAKVAIEAHRHEGVFIARGKEDALVTKNLVPGSCPITLDLPTDRVYLPMIEIGWQGRSWLLMLTSC